MGCDQEWDWGCDVGCGTEEPENSGCVDFWTCSLGDVWTQGGVNWKVCLNGKVWTQYMGLWDVGHKDLGTQGCRNVRTQGCDKQTSPDLCAKN